MGEDQQKSAPRNLTDGDAEAIATALREKVIAEFYADLGKGVWALVWRGLLIGAIAIAAFGAAK